MTIIYNNDLLQGSDEWMAARCGLLTASEMKLILTPTLKIAKNEKTHAHVYELAAQRLTMYTEPSYIGDDMLRGWEDEITARDLYSERISAVQEVGFVTNDQWGFKIGYSPDGLVGDDGLIEIKSRRQKFQAETIINMEVPVEHVLQLQTGLLVTGRKWIDYISYSGGMHMVVIRVMPDPAIHAAIIEAASDFEATVSAAMLAYHKNSKGMIMTERRAATEMTEGEYS